MWIKTSDVFEEDGSYFLNTTKTLYNPNNIVKDYTLVTTKNKTSRRIIDIDKAVYDSLQRIISFNKLLKKEIGAEYHDRDFVFVNTGKYPGHPLYIKFIQHRMNRMLHLTGLNPNLTPHSLRHTHTSLLSEAGVSLERIMRRLGHANDKITKRIYLHTTKAVRQRDADKFKKLS